MWGGQGEWSVAMRSMVPSMRACQSCSRLAALRMAGADLQRVGPLGLSGMVSAVRWRKWGQVSTVTGRPSRLAACDEGEGLGGGEVDDVQAEGLAAVEGVAGEFEEHLDGVELGFVGARGEVGGVLASSRRWWR